MRPILGPHSGVGWNALLGRIAGQVSVQGLQGKICIVVRNRFCSVIHPSVIRPQTTALHTLFERPERIPGQDLAKSPAHRLRFQALVTELGRPSRVLSNPLVSFGPLRSVPALALGFAWSVSRHSCEA